MRPALPQERRRLLDGLTRAGAFSGAERRLVITNQYDGGLTVPPGPPAAQESDTAAAGTARMLERFAAPFLGGGGDPETTPRVLHGLVFAAAEDKAWPEVQTLSSRLAERFPGYASAPDVLNEVAARATATQQWPIVRSSYQYVLALNRNTVLTPAAQLNYAEALFRTDATAQARIQLKRFLDIASRAEDVPRALHLLAEVYKALDQPAEALAADERARPDYPQAEWTAESLMPPARLLQYAVGKAKRARALLREAVRRTQGELL